MKYMLLIYNNPESPWTGSEEDQQSMRELLALDKELAESGELVSSEGLALPDEARIVRVRGGVPLVTDGPFVEANEHLAGYFLVECEAVDRAIEIAARTSEAVSYPVEVRPVMDAADMQV